LRCIYSSGLNLVFVFASLFPSALLFGASLFGDLYEQQTKYTELCKDIFCSDSEEGNEASEEGSVLQDILETEAKINNGLFRLKAYSAQLNSLNSSYLIYFSESESNEFLQPPER